MTTRRNGLALALGLISIVAGCSPSALEQTVPFNLAPSLGSFRVVAGEPAENSGIALFDPSQFNLGHGRIALRPEDITFTPDPLGGGKGRVNFQAGSSLEVTAFVAAPEDLETVCVDGEEYGPFTVELDESFVPVSVSPSSFTLSSDTLALIEAGQISICLRVVAPVSGELVIERLSLTLGL